MSAENLELVRQLIPGPEVDIAVLARDDQAASAAAEALAAYYHPDLESVTHGPDGEVTYKGLDGLRETWLDWLSPWESYRIEAEELVDLGDRVVVLVRDRGHRKGLEHEVELIGASIWTVREGKIARVEFYANRAEALTAAGLDPARPTTPRRSRA
jgi:ketosteroid isomerase-like protein